MTIETQASKVHYAGNGSTTVFPVPFPVHKAEHLVVVVTAGGADTVLTSGYTVTGAGTGAVSVTCPASGAALADGTRITIFRKVPFIQQMDLENGGAFDAEIIERQFDVTEMQIQQLAEAQARAVTVPITSDITPDDLVRDIFGAADSAAESATAAAESARQADASAQAAKSSETATFAARDSACVCAGRSEAARDVALSQVITFNQIMATEMGKVNAIIATNKDDQQAAIDEAKRWADAAREISIPAATATARGAIKIGTGLTMAADDKLSVDVSSFLPRGAIILWAGAITAVPVGWVLCNGYNGTPDLRDRFVVGAGGGYAVDAKGGAISHPHTVTVGNTTLTTEQTPYHDHYMYYDWSTGTDTSIINDPNAYVSYHGQAGGEGKYMMRPIWAVGKQPSAGRTSGVGANTPHGHSAWSDTKDHRPPYYALAYIMKL